MAPERSIAVDVTKAAAIVTVVWIHAVADPFDLRRLPVSAFLTAWAVPAFFAASGFLHRRAEPVSGAELGRWLRRLLVPYVVATAVALAFRATVRGERLDAGDALFALATGSAWGIYYFVPVLVGAVALAALLSHRPRLGPPLAVLFVASGFAPAVGLEPFAHLFGVFGLLRSPFTWWGYFLAGWTLAGTPAPSPSWRRRIGVAALAGWLAVVGACTHPGPCDGGGWAVLVLGNWLLLAALFHLGAEVPRWAPVEFLSRTSYPIYLYHFFFADTVRAWGPRLGEHPRALAFVAGTLGALAIVAAGRRLLGRHARLVLG